MMQSGIKATSELLWVSALVAALADVGLVVFLNWWIKAARFRQYKWVITGVSLVFWSGVWLYAMWGNWWELAYHHIFPTWARYVVPPSYGLLFGAVGMGIWWLALRLPGYPVVNFCLLGGLVSLPGHLWAIYGRAMLDKVPLLQTVSPASALVFGIFEFIVYWSFILVIAALLRGGWELWRGTAERNR